MPSAPSAKACQTRLKSFCNDIEQSVKKLRQIEADMTTNSTTRGKQVHKRFNKETQRQQQQIIMQELYMKCKSMHEVSEGMMTSLEIEIVKFGSKGENSESTRSKKIENKENTVNGRDRNRASHLDTTTVDDKFVEEINRGDISVCASTHDHEVEEEIFIDPSLMDTSTDEATSSKDNASQQSQYIRQNTVEEISDTNGDGYDDNTNEIDEIQQVQQLPTLHIDTVENEEIIDVKEKLEDTPKSPARRHSFASNADGPKTPSLKDMGLSKATCGAISYPLSPDENDNMSPIEIKMLGSEKSTPKSPEQVEKSIFIDSSSKSKHINEASFVSRCNTPPSPELICEFTTCSLQEVTCSLHPAVMEYLENDRSTLDVFHQPTSAKADSPISKEEGIQEHSTSKVEAASSNSMDPIKAYPKNTYDSDDDEDVDGGIKTKILTTRRDADGRAIEEWIPLIEASEWATAPMSLKVQISSQDILNSGIISLNKFIFTHQNKRDESFTLEEMTTVVSSHIDSVSVNVFALSLVHLKRLELAMENSIRVYKVKRYY